jgi:hypothetical protein
MPWLAVTATENAIVCGLMRDEKLDCQTLQIRVGLCHRLKYPRFTFRSNDGASESCKMSFGPASYRKRWPPRVVDIRIWK